MVAPGLAGLDTVMVLHDAKRIGHPRAVWGVTDGNPVHHDVREIARLTGVDFALDVTLNRDQQIIAVFAGDLSVEHAAACEAARRDAMQPVGSAVRRSAYYQFRLPARPESVSVGEGNLGGG